MTKTCPDCQAEVLSTSQPNRVDTMLEMQKLYVQFGDDEEDALRYATRLLKYFVAEHFQPNPDWKPLPDLIGVLTQLDNAITIAREYKTKLAALAATPAVPVRLEAWIRENFAGHGRALRREGDAPLDGEPWMSMDDAKELTRQAVTLFGRAATPARAMTMLLDKEKFVLQVETDPDLDCEAGGIGSLTIKDLLEEADQYRHPDFDSDCEKLVVKLADALAATPAVGGEREALQTALAFIDTALVADENPTMSKRTVVRIIREALAAQPASPLRGRESLETLIREYARDLRRNSSGGDDYPWEIMNGVADYLDILIGRASPPEQPAAAPVTGRLTFCEKCNANRVHYRSKIIDGVQTFECPICCPTAADKESKA